jgi:hyperosmotically inducible periplasmic protein
MKTKSIVACILAAALAGPALVAAGEPDADISGPSHGLKDAALVTAVRTNLAANHLASLMHLTVETDGDGVVWLGGTAGTQEAADRAVEIARTTDGVDYVKSSIEVVRASR